MGSKYVTGWIRTSLGKHLTAVIIPDYIGHSDIRHMFIDDSPVSAGFFSIGVVAQCDAQGAASVNVSVNTYSRSVSLDLGPKPEDKALLEKALGFREYY